MLDKRKKTGNYGEELAVIFLKKKGYKIIDINFKIKGIGELDIIAKKRGKIVFVEVRTKSTNYFGTPEESITFKKQRKLLTLAHFYIQQKKLLNTPFSIDGVFVDLSQSNLQIRHIEDMLNICN